MLVDLMQKLFAFLFVCILLFASSTPPPTCPPPRYFHSDPQAVGGDPQAAVWESGEAAIEFLKQRL